MQAVLVSFGSDIMQNYNDKHSHTLEVQHSWPVWCLAEEKGFKQQLHPPTHNFGEYRLPGFQVPIFLMETANNLVYVYYQTRDTISYALYGSSALG